MLKIIELFAGIGSQTQALKNIGIEHEVVGIAEIDKYAIQSYEALHGKVNNFGDISKIEKLPYADLWTYSFPCQSISVAGNMEGFNKGDGTRSGLLWEVERLLEISEKPKYLLMENVKNLVSSTFIGGFKDWIEKLNTLGYKNYYKVINASSLGVPQERERVFMVSVRNDIQLDFIFPDNTPLKFNVKDCIEEVHHKVNKTLLPYFEECHHKIYATKNKLLKVFDGESQGIFTSDFTNKRIYSLEGNSPTITCANKINFKEIKGYINGNEALLLMGFKKYEVDKLSFLTDNQRYKLAGNSICVPVLEEIFKNLLI